MLETGTSGLMSGEGKPPADWGPRSSALPRLYAAASPENRTYVWPRGRFPVLKAPALHSGTCRHIYVLRRRLNPSRSRARELSPLRRVRLNGAGSWTWQAIGRCRWSWCLGQVPLRTLAGVFAERWTATEGRRISGGPSESVAIPSWLHDSAWSRRFSTVQTVSARNLARNLRRWQSWAGRIRPVRVAGEVGNDS